MPVGEAVVPSLTSDPKGERDPQKHYFRGTPFYTFPVSNSPRTGFLGATHPVYTHRHVYPHRAHPWIIPTGHTNMGHIGTDT